MQEAADTVMTADTNQDEGLTASHVKYQARGASGADRGANLREHNVVGNDADGLNRGRAALALVDEVAQQLRVAHQSCKEALQSCRAISTLAACSHEPLPGAV